MSFSAHHPARSSFDEGHLCESGPAWTTEHLLSSASPKLTAPSRVIRPPRVFGTDKGAYADLLLWEGNPLENIDLILDEDKLNFIMKDGLVYKNTIVEDDHPHFRPARAPSTRGQYPL